jgi:hypothetical protein
MDTIMDPAYLELVVKLLRGRGPGRREPIRFEPGLTDAEVARTEETYGFRFPADLRALLQRVLPLQDPPPPYPWNVSATEETPLRSHFPDWRHESEESLRERLDRPLEGILWHVRHGEWRDWWGPQPSDLESAVETVRGLVAAAPRLIPIFGHRYLPSPPTDAGNPVFSVLETDIIYYGYDLADYLAAEFFLPRPDSAANRPRVIPFWAPFCGVPADDDWFNPPPGVSYPRPPQRVLDEFWSARRAGIPDPHWDVPESRPAVPPGSALVTCPCCQNYYVTDREAPAPACSDTCVAPFA